MSNFEIRRIPTTAALLEQKLHSADTVQRWWYQKLNDGSLLATQDEWRTEVPGDPLHEDYAKWIGRTRDRSTETGLSAALKKLLPKGFPKKRRLRRVRHWGFPSLKECREHFARNVMKQDIPWPED